MADRRWAARAIGAARSGAAEASAQDPSRRAFLGRSGRDSFRRAGPPVGHRPRADDRAPQAPGNRTVIQHRADVAIARRGIQARIRDPHSTRELRSKASTDGASLVRRASSYRLRIAPRRIDDGGMLTPTRCQAARGLLQWTRERLARESGVDLALVVAFELDQLSADTATIAALSGALEAAGIGLAGAGDSRITTGERREFG
jgi:hypothetical protein